MKKTRLKSSKEKYISNWFSTKLSITKLNFVLLSIRISDKTLKFDNIRVNKKEIHKSKEPIDLDLLNVDQIVVPDKFRQSDGGFKYFIDYKEDKIVKLLCIMLPQMTGYIKYLEIGGKNMSFVIKDDMCLNKYNEIWSKIKETLSIIVCMFLSCHVRVSE